MPFSVPVENRLKPPYGAIDDRDPVIFLHTGKRHLHEHLYPVPEAVFALELCRTVKKQRGPHLEARPLNGIV